MPPARESILLEFMRYYLAKRPDEALAQLSGYDETRQRLLLGLLSAAVAIDKDGTKNLDPQESAVIASQLKGVVLDLLSPKASLVMTKACLCTLIRDYGDFDPISSGYRYVPEGHVEIYIELQNFTKNNKGSGNEIWLSSRVDFFYADGQPVPNSHIEFPQDRFPTSTNAMSRDVHRAYTFNLPQSLAPGRYTMKLQVQDMPSHKTVERSF